MATLTSERDVSFRVHHPLERLRGLIRLYVGLEGLATLVLYLAAWFWIGLLLDYGFFQVFTLDWVQELPLWFRAALLVGLTAGAIVVVLTKVGLRLFHDFRPAALALVLERRFPQVLGDRLITAVELADSEKSEDTYSYSPALLQETVREAGERVALVPVHEAFDWRRLRKRGVGVLALTLGLYVLIGAFYCSYKWIGPTRYVHRFNEVAFTWLERNILLRDSTWPRRAFLELLNEPFVTGDEWRIGRDAPPPTLRVRAWKWVIADADRRKAPEGWRPLNWSDLTPELLGAPVEVDAVPEAWRHALIDQIENQLERAAGNGAWSPAVITRVREIIAQLHERAAEPGMNRRFRELEIPSEITVYYRGASSRNEQTMQKQVDNEYSGAADLKESARFTVRGKNYYTAWKKITIVPPPVIIEMLLEEAQPAYLYHRAPAGGSKKDLVGRKQRFSGRPASLTGETSRIDVPAGTDIVLTGRIDKPVKVPSGVTLIPPKKGVPPVHSVVEQPDPQTFRVGFRDVTAPLDFVFHCEDADGVAGSRHVIIRPIEDLPPEADVQIEVVRKTNQGYLVTPQAMVPFSGKVRDDHGLDQVEYAYTLTRLASAAEAGSQSAGAAAAAGMPAAGTWSGIAALPLLTSGAGHRPAEGAEPQVHRTSLATFEQLLRERARNDVSLETLLSRLDQPPGEPLLKDYTLDPEQEFFSVERLGLKITEDKAAQPHYRLQLWVVATDNNVETGPRTGESKDRFTLLIVSENELLTEIAKEEESLRVKLEEAINRLKDGRIKLNRVAQELPELKREELSPIVRRAEEVGEGVIRSWDSTREVYGDYQRILRELRANRVQAAMVTKVNDKICEPLDGAINLEFVQADEAVRELQRKLEAGDKDPKSVEVARQQLDRLIARLSTVLDAMAEVTTINKIIEMLLKIEKAEQEEYARLQRLLKQKQDEVLDNLSEPKKP